MRMGRKTARKAVALLSLITAVTTLNGCAKEVAMAKEPGQMVAQTQEAADYPTADEANGTLAQGVNRFAFEMAGYLETDSNYFFSPYSLASALTLLGNAAGGETKAQVDGILGIRDMADWNMQFGFYNAQEQPQDAYLTSANSLWFDLEFEPYDALYEEYIPLVDYYYGAELFYADFRNQPQETLTQINDWVSGHTDGMITDFMQNVNADTVMAMINAVYFYGEWTYPFEAIDTREDTFYGQSGDTTVSMMHAGDLQLPYYEAHGLRGISLPYGENQDKVMNILIPADGESRSTAELFANLTPEEQNGLLTALTEADPQIILTLSMPKFEMTYTINSLTEILMQMGMIDAFGFSAEFPMLGNVYVSNAIHKAKIEVDELGSRAAAATGFEFDLMSLAPPVGEVFHVNHPFLFFIQDAETGMILFMGQVSNL